MSIEIADLDEKIQVINELETKESDIEVLDEMISDVGGDSNNNTSESQEELDSMHQEKREAFESIKDLETTLTRLLLPRDDVDDNSAIVELRCGTGGLEASLFTAEMLRMYQRYSANVGYQFEILSISTNDGSTGVREAVVSIKGRGVYGRLKYESGVHRVQRVPVNDSRLHTSTMSVAVLPEVEEIDATLSASDLRIDVYRASGAGGQHVNTTESAVRITHIPTGLVAAVQDERSQHQNRNKAMKILGARVLDLARRTQAAERDSLRSSQIGSGDRSERIRTYNFKESRVTDHRINKTLYGLDSMLQGLLLNDFIDPLIIQAQNEMLASL